MYTYTFTYLLCSLSPLQFVSPMVDMEVIVLKEGYCRNGDSAGHFKASGSITLIKGEHQSVLVDTGNPWDTGELISGR